MTSRDLTSGSVFGHVSVWPRYIFPTLHTSSAVTKRPCSAVAQYVDRKLLLLVTSASDLPPRTIKLRLVLFGVLGHAVCDKQDSLMRGGLCCKPTSTVITAINYCTVHHLNCWSHFTSQLSESQILVENRDFAYPTCIRRPVRGFPSNIAIRFDTEKREWFGYPRVKNFEDMFICLFVSTEYTKVTDGWKDRQTDGRTPCDSISCAYA